MNEIKTAIVAFLFTMIIQYMLEPRDRTWVIFQLFWGALVISVYFILRWIIKKTK